MPGQDEEVEQEQQGDTAADDNASEEQDLEALLLSPDKPATDAEAKEDAETEETVEADADATETADDDKEEAAATEKPKPGTPDKAIQKLQQDLAAATRKIDELHGKRQAGETLTGNEERALEQNKRKIDSVREALEAKSFDFMDHGQAVAEALTETDQTVSDLRRELDELKAQNRQTQQSQVWVETEKLYPGVKVKQVWDQSLKDAQAMTDIGADDIGNPKLRNALTKAASTLFHQRCAAATKSVAAKTAPPKKPTTPPRTPAPVTPNGARVRMNTAQQTSGQSQEAREMRDYMALVKDD